jgi:hypothetical protein
MGLRRWFLNLIALQEKRAYDTFVLLLFCVFVAGVRVLLEWLLGGFATAFPLPVFVSFVAFYWSCIFALAVILRLVVPSPWRSTVNVVLTGVFLGVLPPFIDVLLAGRGAFLYRYDFDFPNGGGFAMYAPANGVPMGETIIVWSTIAFTMLYVAVRTRTAWRVLLAGALCYVAMLWNGALLPTSIVWLSGALGLPEGSRGFLMVLTQTLVPLVFYLGVLRPEVGRWLLWRSQHALPFVLMCLLGGLLTAPWHVGLGVYAALLYVVVLVCLAQNDCYDIEEDAAGGRPMVVDREDKRFLEITGGLLLLCVGLYTSSATVIPLTVFLAVSYLYSYPFYRGKKYFPANLKMEGVWGWSAFLVGAVAGMEYHAMQQLPPWTTGESPYGRVTGPFPAAVGVGALLAFAGHSVLAILKDYKDWQADLSARVQTVYTLAHRRGYSVERLHARVVILAMLCLAASVVLLTFVRTLPMASIALGLLPALFLGWVSWSRRSFGWSLLAIDLHLAALASMLVYGGVDGG